MVKTFLVFMILLATISCGVGASSPRKPHEELPRSTGTRSEIIGATPVSAKDSDDKKMDNANITIEATAGITDGKLVINYQIKNLSDREVYVWDQMIGYEGNEQVIDEDAAYVFLEEPDTLRIIRADLELPSGLDVARKEIPFVRQLPPKGKLTGSVKLSVPVKEFSPFFPELKPENGRSVKCSNVKLMVAWTPSQEGMKVSERKVGGTEVLALRGAWDGAYQNVAEQTIPLDVDVIAYKTEFERSSPKLF